jgi:DNA-directed RNA polymerase subunit M/transcription elongation factor TFIIS
MTTVISSAPPSVRDAFVDLVQSKTGISRDEAKDAEVGVFNWCIAFSDRHAITKNWRNPKFTQLYHDKARSVLGNLDAESYVANPRLIARMRDREFRPHELATMRPDNMCPERWKDLMEAQLARLQNAYETKVVAMTDQFQCGRCKKRECTFSEMFTRRADEASTVFVRCLNCGNHWTMG